MADIGADVVTDNGADIGADVVADIGAEIVAGQTAPVAAKMSCRSVSKTEIVQVPALSAAQ